jgi:predicted ATPase
VRTEGDAVFAAFGEAGTAVGAAATIARETFAETRPDGLGVRVRVALHTGEAHRAGDDYGGFEVNRAARIAAAGHGGQVILSEATATLVADALPAGTSLRDLGVHAFRDVPRPTRVHQLDIAGLPTTFPPLRTRSVAPGDVPDRLTSFIGRDEELDRLEALAREARLITLTGPGGIGKSSLGIELARRLEPAHPDGAWLVRLDAIDDPVLVGPAIARAIGVFDGTDRSAEEALPAFLLERRLLLILDNFEHVLDAAPLVSTLLQGAPGLRVIVTSRAALRVRGEHDVPVRSLPTRGDGAAARRLFVERARAVRPDWDPDQDPAALDAICELLDGLPLGLELAAARVGTLPLRTIRDRLTRRLPLPGSGPRDAPDRQRALEATVAWSDDLLPASTRPRFHGLSVFDGGFDLEQAAAVVGDPDGDLLDDVARLVDHSLIELDAEHDGRYRMLRTIQSYALGQAAASGAELELRRRHALAFLALARREGARLTTDEQADAMDRLAPDDANLASAIRWAIDAGEAELSLQLLAALWRYWQVSGQLGRTRSIADEALRMPGAQAPTVDRMWAIAARGSMAYWGADITSAKRDYEEQHRIATALDHEPGIADAVFNLGHVTFIDDADPAVMVAVASEAEARFQALGDERGVARARWARSAVAMSTGHLDEARRLLHEDLAEFARLRDGQYLAMTESSLGWMALLTGDLVEAARWGRLGVSHTYAMRDVATSTIGLHVGVLFALAAGRAEDGARLAGAYDVLCERYGVRPPAMLGQFIRNYDPFGDVTAALGVDTYQRLYAEGRRLELDQAVALMLELADAAEGRPTTTPTSESG